MANFSELNEDAQYALLQKALPKLDQAEKLIDEIQDLIFSPGFYSPFPDMSDPIAAQSIEEAQLAIGHLKNQLGYKQKKIEEILLKANQIWHKEKPAPKGWDLIEA